MVVVHKKIVLADLSIGICVERFENDGQIIIDVQSYPDAAEQKLFDRGNVVKGFSFTATRQHADEETAELFTQEHIEAVLGKGPLLVMGSFKHWQRFYNEAACVRCNCYAEGVRTWTSYQFTTGLSSKKAKTTQS